MTDLDWSAWSPNGFVLSDHGYWRANFCGVLIFVAARSSQTKMVKDSGAIFSFGEILP